MKKVFIFGGYGGSVKAEVRASKKLYVLDVDYIEKFLEKQIKEKGYTVSKTNRQKYERLIINE